jgi:hypothetical protein
MQMYFNLVAAHLPDRAIGHAHFTPLYLKTQRGQRFGYVYGTYRAE